MVESPLVANICKPGTKGVIPIGITHNSFLDQIMLINFYD